MDVVSLFWILSSFLLPEWSTIAAEDVRVSIDPQKKEVVVEMNNLLNLAYGKEKGMVNRQLQDMQQQNFEWSPTMDAFQNKSLQLIVHKKTIDARINFQYTDEKDLKEFGITADSTSFHLFHLGIEPISVAKRVDEFYWAFPKNRRIEFKDKSQYNSSLDVESVRSLRIDPSFLKMEKKN